MKKSRRDKQKKDNYRIFRVEESVKCHGLPKKVTTMRITAEDDNDAYL
jgi:hypothetical protein